MGDCDYCDNKATKICGMCEDTVCKDHSEKCENCEMTLCSGACPKKCDDCNEYYCNNDGGDRDSCLLARCETCGDKVICYSCGHWGNNWTCKNCQ